MEAAELLWEKSNSSLESEMYNKVRNGWESGMGERVEYFFINKYE